MVYMLVNVCLHSNCITILDMAGVLNGDETVCLQCDCQYESRNTLVIKVGLIVCVVAVSVDTFYNRLSFMVCWWLSSS